MFADACQQCNRRSNRPLHEPHTPTTTSAPVRTLNSAPAVPNHPDAASFNLRQGARAQSEQGGPQPCLRTHVFKFWLDASSNCSGTSHHTEHTLPLSPDPPIPESNCVRLQYQMPLKPRWQASHGFPRPQTAMRSPCANANTWRIRHTQAHTCAYTPGASLTASPI